jgi:hypothetical protein
MKISVKNSAHYGDCMAQLQWCIKVCQLDTYYEVDFYVNSSFIPDLKNFIHDSIKDRCRLFYIEYAPDDCIETWIKDIADSIGMSKVWHFEKFMVDFFNHISNHFKIENPIIKKEDFLYDNPNILHPNELSDHYDYLVLNYPSNSGNDICNNHEKYRDICLKLKEKGHKIITAIPVSEDILCIQRHNLRNIDLANLSINSDVILASSTGAIFSTLNKYSHSNNPKRITLESMGLSSDLMGTICRTWEEVYKELDL